MITDTQNVASQLGPSEESDTRMTNTPLRRALRSVDLSDRDLDEITKQVALDLKLDAEDMDEYDLLVGALLNPFNNAAQGLQVPGTPDGCLLYHNETEDSVTIPSGADRMVVALDAIGAARNGEIGATIYFVDSSKVSKTAPQVLDDGSIVGSRYLSFNMDAQRFDCYDVFSAGISVEDHTSSLYRRGTSSAINLVDRTTHPAQLYPGKIGRLTDREQDSIVGVTKSNHMIATSHNVSSVRGGPFRQGFSGSGASYKNGTQGAISKNGYGRSGSQFSGTSNDSNYGQWAPFNQMIQSLEERTQRFYVGAAPDLHVIPNYGGTESDQQEYLVWSSMDMPSLTDSGGGNIDPFAPRDCNAIRLNGEIKLGGVMDSSPTAIQGGTTSTTCDQGYHQQGVGAVTDGFFTFGVTNGSGTTNSLDSISGGSYVNNHGESINSNGNGSSNGYLAYAPAYASQNAGGWLVKVQALGSSETVGFGIVKPRVIGEAQIYGVIGTDAQVSYVATRPQLNVGPGVDASGQPVLSNSFASTTEYNTAPYMINNYDQFGIGAVSASTKSIGSICMNGIVVRPGMGGITCSAGEAVTGVQIKMVPYTAAPWNNGSVRVLQCSETHNGVVTATNFTTSSTGYANPNALVEFTAPSSSNGRAATGAAFVNASGAAAGLMNMLSVLDSGFGYTAPPTMNVYGSAGVVFDSTTCTVSPMPALPILGSNTDGSTVIPEANVNGNQFTIKVDGISGEFIKYDSDLGVSPKQVIIMDGLIPIDKDGSSSCTVSLQAYSSARLKAYEAPISTQPYRNNSKKSMRIKNALEVIAAYSPNLYSSPLSHSISNAIFNASGGHGAALHAASSGWASRLYNIGKNMIKSAKFQDTEKAITSLSKDLSRKIRRGLRGETAKVRNQVVNAVDKQLAKMGVHAGTDGVPTGAGFWGDFSKGFNSVVDTATKVIPVVAPLLAGTDAMPTNACSYAASGEFAVIDNSGGYAGTKTLQLTKTPIDECDYNLHHLVDGIVGIDKKLVTSSKSIPQILSSYMSTRPEIQRIYVSVGQSGDIYGESWEAAAISALSNDNSIITGKIDDWSNNNGNIVVELGPIRGVKSKAQGVLSEKGLKLRVPDEHGDEANVESVSVIRI